MKKQTRQVFGQYETRLGQLNDTDNVAKTFSVTPSVQQKLETKMQESSEFLTKVNIIGVTEQEGEKLGLGVSGPIAGAHAARDRRGVAPGRGASGSARRPGRRARHSGATPHSTCARGARHRPPRTGAGRRCWRPGCCRPGRAPSSARGRVPGRTAAR